jgi:hypothetical protein
MSKEHVGARVSESRKDVIERYQEVFSVTQADAVRDAVDALAEKHGLEPPTDDDAPEWSDDDAVAPPGPEVTDAEVGDDTDRTTHGGRPTVEVEPVDSGHGDPFDDDDGRDAYPSTPAEREAERRVAELVAEGYDREEAAEIVGGIATEGDESDDGDTDENAAETDGGEAVSPDTASESGAPASGTPLVLKAGVAFYTVVAGGLYALGGIARVGAGIAGIAAVACLLAAAHASRRLDAAPDGFGAEGA